MLRTQPMIYSPGTTRVRFQLRISPRLSALCWEPGRLMAESIPEIGDTGPGAEVEEVAKEALALLSKHHAGTLSRSASCVGAGPLPDRRELKKETTRTALGAPARVHPALVTSE